MEQKWFDNLQYVASFFLNIFLSFLFYRIAEPNRMHIFVETIKNRNIMNERLKLTEQVKLKFGSLSEEYRYCLFVNDKKLKSFCRIFNIR
jgi:hypothetical protein